MKIGETLDTLIDHLADSKVLLNNKLNECPCKSTLNDNNSIKEIIIQIFILSYFTILLYNMYLLYNCHKTKGI